MVPEYYDPSRPVGAQPPQYGPPQYGPPQYGQAQYRQAQYGPPGYPAFGSPGLGGPKGPGYPGRPGRSGRSVLITITTLIVIGAAVIAGIMYASRGDTKGASAAAPNGVQIQSAGPSLATSAVTVPGSVPVEPRDLQVGQCAEFPVISGRIRTLSVLPCTSQHNAQVYWIVASTDATFPGDDQMKTEGLNLCHAQIAPFLGVSETPLHYVELSPIQSQWTAGNHLIDCLLVDRVQDFTGDIRTDPRAK